MSNNQQGWELDFHAIQATVERVARRVNAHFVIDPDKAEEFRAAISKREENLNQVYGVLHENVKASR